jgi:hypothetical protein
MSIMLNYSYMLNAGPGALELYNAHMAVPNASMQASYGHCRICDGLPHAPGTSAAYVKVPVAEEDLLGLFETQPTSKATEDPDLLGLFGAVAAPTEVATPPTDTKTAVAAIPYGSPAWQAVDARKTQALYQMQAQNNASTQAAYNAACTAYSEMEAGSLAAFPPPIIHPPAATPLPTFSGLAGNGVCSANDQRVANAMRMPVMATSVSFMDAMAGQKIVSRFEVSLSEATSIVTHLNGLGDSETQTQSEIAISRIARKMRITPWAVKSVVRTIIRGN